MRRRKQLRRRRVVSAVLMTAVLAAVIILITRQPTTTQHMVASSSKHSSATVHTVLSVSSTTPAAGAVGVDGAADLLVKTAGDPPPSDIPTILPSAAGNWIRLRHGWQFTPDGALTPDTQYTVQIPAAGRFSGYSWSFTTALPTTVRLQQMLAQLGYLPVAFTPSVPNPSTLAGWQASVYTPIPGNFTWRWPGSMPQLQSDWLAGAFGPMTQGAIMQFEQQSNLPVNGKPSTAVWTALIQAAASNSANQSGYTWTYVTKTPRPEQETIWHNGQIVLQSVVNTGIAQDPTADGNYDVYLRYRHQIMRGTNPNGSHYADPVSWVSYFNGGDALHYFNRASYGWPQSLGCVEEPYQAAEQAWQYTTIGTLVTVAG